MKKSVLFLCLLLSRLIAFADVDTDALPDVEQGFEINLFVKEPHIINPSALCFDRHGRLYVGAGPQYRAPKEDSPTDYIKILIDADGDGVVETVKTFAEGLNSVQSMAWKGDELWVANSPELTVLRDTDGDDVADEYRIVYTGLNNLRHALHGLNWGPDGWLYMTIGNTWVKPNAPKPIRDLQGIKSNDTTQYPLTKVYTKETYRKSYHPINKSEKEGGVFRCRPGGYDLELYARGMRNPWDMCMDSGFNWLATDNDPGPPADRIFMPIRHGHYGMRHPWKFDWKGEHIAVAPSSDLFPGVSGSGTGVVFYTSNHFPEKYQNRYLIADWTNNCIFLYHPKWDGALQVPAEMKRRIVESSGGYGDLQWKGEKGRSLFRPTDIEVGPDGALYMAGWGSVYGTEYVPKDKWTPEENAKYQGRVFRLRHKDPLIPRATWDTKKRKQDIETWSFAQLMEDIGHQVHVWRVHAQDELVRRGAAVRGELLKAIQSGDLTEMEETWSTWALGHIEKATGNDHTEISKFATAGTSVSLRIQATRILGENQYSPASLLLIRLLGDPEPRIRTAAMQSLDRIGWGDHVTKILDAIADESDRVAFYTDWQILRRQVTEKERRILLEDERAGIRLMAALGLMEEGDRSLQKRLNDYLKTDGSKPDTQPTKPLIPRTMLTLTATERDFRDSTKIRFQTHSSGYLSDKISESKMSSPLKVDIGRSGEEKPQSGWEPWSFSGSGGTKNESKSFPYTDASDGTLEVTLTTTTNAEGRNYGLSQIKDPENLKIPDVWRDQFFFNNNTSGTMTLALHNLLAGTYAFTSYSYANNLVGNDEGTAKVYVNGMQTPLQVSLVTGKGSQLAGKDIQSEDLHSFGTVSFQFTVAKDGAPIAITYRDLTKGDTFGLNGFELALIEANPVAASAGATKTFDIRYTLDGSIPNAKSESAKGEITVSKDATLTAAAFDGAQQVSAVEMLKIHRITDSEWKDRLFVQNIRVKGSEDSLEVINDGLQRGVLAYADDRGETITDVPDAIAGATVVRTKRSDRDNNESGFLSFDTNLAATIYIAYDSIAPVANWLGDAYAKTDHIITTSQDRKLQVYRRDAAPGNVVLGGNGGADAMYQVYLSKAVTGAGKTTIAATKAVLPKANPKHGEEIFFGRGTCFACHQVAGRGIVVGPDLQGIGKRRDTNYVIQSTLEPDAYIVEGYQQTSLQMADGRKLFGMIQEETGLEIKLVLPTGELVTANPADIRKRDDAKHSGMPASFPYTLSPQDVADVSAWIMNLPPAKTADPKAKSKTTAGVAIEHLSGEKKVVISLGAKPFTEYRYGNPNKPILYPVIGPHSISMTRHYPMKKGVANEATDHPHHQSLYYLHIINGHDFWHARSGAHVRNDKIAKAEMENGEAVIVSHNSWMKDKTVVCTDTTELRFGELAGGRYIDFRITFHASHGPITFNETKEGSMAIRTHPALRLGGKVAKGSAINSEGVTGKAVWGKTAKWVDYWGPIDGKNVGIAIFDHPENPRHPTTWHARDYGLITANPFGGKHFESGQGAMKVEKDSNVTFAYRFLIHEGSHEQARILERYQQWIKK